MQLAWTPHGPPRATSLSVPPTPSLIDWYVVGYDDGAEKVFYVCKPDDDARGGEIHHFDGRVWQRTCTKRLALSHSHLEGGGYDAMRGAVVVWTVGLDYETKRHRPQGFAIASGIDTEIATTGDLPIIEPEGEERVGTFDKHALFTFDAGRRVWVCLTRRGVWELDASGVWSRRSDGALVPQKWRSKSGDGTYDPVAQRTVFMVMAQEGFEMVILAWNGSDLTKLSLSSLPLLHQAGRPVAQIVGHPRHGLVVHAGGGRLFGATGSSWNALPVSASPPPMMEDAFLACDPTRDLLVLGPGKHEGAGGSNRHDVFFVLRDGAWERQGVGITHSPLASASYGKCRMAHVNGGWYATGTHSLRAWKWSGAWNEIVGKVVGEKVGGWEILELLAGTLLHAVTASGAVFALEGDEWNEVRGKDPAFKGRTDFAVATDGDGRIVVWGGESKGRKLNDTLFLEGRKWRVAKKASPQPVDFQHGRRDGVTVEVSAIYDASLRAIVRFGYEGVAVLEEGEVWKAYAPKGYKENVSPRRWGHVPVHDTETGETLVIDFVADEGGKGTARVVRFDLAGCVALGTIEYPSELQPKKQHDSAAYHALAQSFSYDATTRSLYAQVLEDASGVYRLDLAEAFAAAKALGPRTIPSSEGKAPPVFEPCHLYRAKDGTTTTVSLVAKGKKVQAVSGVLGAKGTAKELTIDAAGAFIAEKRKAGFVTAEKLTRDVLVELVGISSRAIEVGTKAKGPLSRSRLGGAPSGVTAKSWPRLRGAPMGFLFQIETGTVLAKHAGVAVFCAMDGEATNEANENVVVLLRAADFDQECAPPEGVPLLLARPLLLASPAVEIDEDRAGRLAAMDPALGAAIERLPSMEGMQTEGLANKLGGIPEPLQGPVAVKRHRFVCQLDVGAIETSSTWPDAGLAGCIYVFVSDDEKKAKAFWQYT